jgi:hypothetical protein
MSQGPHWTKEEVATLKQNAHRHLDEIIPLFPNRNRNGIRCKLKREKLYDQELHSDWGPPTVAGMTYGRLLVLKVELRYHEANQANTTWALVQYECDKECKRSKWVAARQLRAGRTVSCGCYHSERASALSKERHSQNRQQYIGKTFGRLIVIAESDERRVWKGGMAAYVVCECTCKATDRNIATVEVSKLLSGHTRSCGCLSRETTAERSTTHNESRDPLYRRWAGMIARCYQPSHTGYKDYGGRGITVCDEWHRYEAFAEWARANGWDENLTLDRIDTNGPYSAANCRWTTQLEQNNNRRNNIVVTWQGRTQTLSKWARELGFNYRVLRDRLARNWTVARAFTTPVRTPPQRDDKSEEE